MTASSSLRAWRLLIWVWSLVVLWSALAAGAFAELHWWPAAAFSTIAAACAGVAVVSAVRIVRELRRLM